MRSVIHLPKTVFLGVMVMMLGFLSVILPATSVAQDSIDYENYMHFLGQANTWGGSIAAVDHFAYVGGTKVTAFDVSDSRNPTRIGEVDSPGATWYVAADGDLVVAAGQTRLNVIDVSDPSAPSLVGYLDLPFEATGILVRDSFAYLTAGADGLFVYDLSDPANPTNTSGMEFSGSALGAVFNINTLFVALGPSVAAVDITNPASPVLEYELPVNYAKNLAICGGDLCVLAPGRLQVFDLPNDSGPTLLGETTIAVDAISGAADGIFLVVAAGEVGLQVVDLEDPSAPQLLGTIDTPGDAGSVVVSEGVALVSDYDEVSPSISSLLVVDLQDGHAAPILGRLTTGYSFTGIDADDSYVYAGNGGGFKVYDASIPGEPRLLGSADLYYGASDVDISGGYAFVANRYGGLKIFSIDDPSNLTQVGELEFSYTGYVRVFEGIAYCSNEDGIYLVDVSDPHGPTILSDLGIDGYVFAVEEGVAYVSSSGINTFDVSDPSNPVLLGESDISEGSGNAALGNGVAYVAAGNALHVFDVNNIGAPTLVRSITTPSWCWDVALVGNCLYVADHYAGLSVFDVTDAEMPSIIGTVDVEGQAMGVILAQGKVFVASSEGMTIAPLHSASVVPGTTIFPGDTDNNGIVDAYDVLPLGAYFLEEGEPRVASSLDWVGQACGYWSIIGGGYADADGDGLVSEQDLFAVGLNWGRTHLQGTQQFVLNPDDPELRANHRGAFLALYNSLSSTGEASRSMKALLAEILELDGPPHPEMLSLEQNYPNPFNPLTTIRFELPEASSVSLKIYDLGGRMVKSLITNKPYPTGSHVIEFVAGDLSSGTYFYRLSTDHGVVVRKMTIIK